MYSLLCMLAALALATADPLSNAGTEFVVICNQASSNSNPQSLLYVETTEDQPVQFTVSDGSTSVTETTGVAFDVADDFDLDSALLIESSDGTSQLVVMGLITFNSGLTGDTFTAFPTHQYASYTYFAMSTQDLDSGHHGFMELVGTEDNTEVTITPKIDLAGNFQCMAGEMCTFSLQKLESWFLKNNRDLSGTKITSNKPLAVLSGHECAQVPESFGNCELLIEQIPPVATWGKSFLVGPLLKRNTGEIYKIVSSEKNTSVDVYCSSDEHVTAELVLEGDFYKFNTNSNGRTCSFRANKPVLVVLLAPSDSGTDDDGAFMSVVPPVKQYVNSISFTLLNADGRADSNRSVTITVPDSSCSTSECSVIVDDSSTIDIAAMAEPIHCSPSEVCGHAVSVNLSAGAHILRMAQPDGRMGVIASAAHKDAYGHGTVAGMALNHIAVSSPNVIISYDGPLLAGERLELTCSITVPGGLVQGTQVSARLLRGDERELKRVEQDAYKLEHVFEALSLEDSDVYKCEATITSQHAGVLATSSQSMDITVLDYHYIQLLLVGVGKCSEYLVGDTEGTANILSKEVARLINKGCSCSFSSEFITMPTLKCPPANSASSDKLLFRAGIQEGGRSPVSYHDVITSLQAAKNETFRFKAILVTIDPEKECSVEINDIADRVDCLSDGGDTASTGAVSSGRSEDNSRLIIAAVVPSCVAVVLCVLLVVVSVVLSRQSGAAAYQRPKSIHLHHRMASGGDSVTSFCPDSGSNSSNVYVPRESIPSSPSTLTSSPLHQNGGIQHQEQKDNYEIMKTDLSKIEMPLSAPTPFSDV